LSDFSSCCRRSSIRRLTHSIRTERLVEGQASRQCLFQEAVFARFRSPTRRGRFPLCADQLTRRIICPTRMTQAVRKLRRSFLNIEFPSQFRGRENQRHSQHLSRERNRKNNFEQFLPAHVFAQAGPLADVGEPEVPLGSSPKSISDNPSGL